LVFYLGIAVTIKNLTLRNQFLREKINLPNFLENWALSKAIGWCLIAIAGLFILIVVCEIRQIHKAGKFIKAASEFMGSNFLVILVPLIIFLLVTATILFWVYFSMCLYSTGDFNPNSNFPYASVTIEKVYQNLLLYLLFGAIWTCEVFSALNIFIIACGCSLWYFGHAKSSLSDWKICKSFHWGLTKSLGSLCVGSLLVALIKFVRIIIYMAEKTQVQDGNKCAKLLSACCHCYLRCCQSIVRFITENAFVMMAIEGKNFCVSAKDAMGYVAKEFELNTISRFLTSYFCLIGKLAITCGTTTLGYLIIISQPKYYQNIYSPGFPTFIFAVISYIIASIFTELFYTSVITIVFCYCYDKDLNNG